MTIHIFNARMSMSTQQQQQRDKPKKKSRLVGGYNMRVVSLHSIALGNVAR